MILQALNDLYAQLLAEGDVEAPGFQQKEIPWVITLAPGGKFAGLTRTGGGGPKDRGARYAVPAEIKKTSGIASNLLWENPEYALGVPKAGIDAKQAAKVPERHAAFVRRIRDLPPETLADDGVAAVLAFLQRNNRAELEADPLWENLRESGANVSFRLEGDEPLVCTRPAVRAALSGTTTDKDHAADQPWCLVTGRRGTPARLHPSIKGVFGGQPTGTSLVAFNQDAFKSHGWEQGENAPVSEAAAQAYAAALNYLLEGRHDNSRVTTHREGETTFVFWAADRRSDILKYFPLALGEKAETKPESDGTEILGRLESVREGFLSCRDDKTAVFVLVLAPNVARLAVRSWTVTRADVLAGRFLDHLDALKLETTQADPPLPTLWRLLGELMPDGDIKLMSNGLRSRLSSDIVSAILNGTPYPATLLARAVERCRLENSVRPLRAALIKAVLSRQPTFKKRPPTMSLDPECADTGYLLGRQFAVLESIQHAAQGKINVTIRDRYFGAAMASPRAVQPQLERLKNAHLKKLRRDKAFLGIFFEKELGTITDKLTAERGYPASLRLDEQGLFILGYHHQRHQYLTRHDATPPEVAAELTAPPTATHSED